MKTFGAALAAALLIVGLAGLFGAPAPAVAAPADPAAAQIDSFDAQLIQVMKDAKSLGVQGRFRRFLAFDDRYYDFATMISFAVGPDWAKMTPAQHAALTTAFARLTAASYAHNFDGYSGERFTVDPVVTRGPDKVVTTHLISPGQAPVTIAYRMRQSGGTWKIIDVFYNGAISQLTTRRADFASTLAHGGAPALITHLDQLVESQLK